MAGSYHKLARAVGYSMVITRPTLPHGPHFAVSTSHLLLLRAA